MRIKNKNSKGHKKTFNKRKSKNTTKRSTKKHKYTRKRKITKGGMEQKEIEDECPICYQKLNDPDNPDITLSCNHTFHRNCIIDACRHIRGPCTCPICRRELTPEDLENLGIAQPQPQERDPPRIFQLAPRVPPSLETIDEFRIYINDKLRHPTRTPLEKLENELEKFIGTDSLPVELYEDAMEFELEQRGPAAFHRYRFIRIIDLEDIPPPENRLNKKYFRYIDYWSALQNENPNYYEENHDDDHEQDMILAYDVFEV
jgi:hypothetical protein